MVVDTSALIAILLDEPGHAVYREALLSAASVEISAGTAVELGIVAERRAGAQGEAWVENLLAEFNIDIVPVDAEQTRLAWRACRLFGKGRHKAGLNYGDVFAYALSKASGQPLLFKGDDFRLTDVRPAL